MDRFMSTGIADQQRYLELAATLPAGVPGDWRPDPARVRREALRDAAVRWGLREVLTPLFADPVTAGAFGGPEAVLVANPLKSTTKALRGSLLPGLLATVRANLPRVECADLVELGVVVRPVAGGGATEHHRLGVLLWRRRAHGDGIIRRDVADAVVTILRTAGFGTPEFAPIRRPGFESDGGAVVLLGGRAVGMIGIPNRSAVPDVARLGRPAVAELDVDTLTALPVAPALVRPAPIGRPVELDVTLVVPLDVLTHQVVEVLVAGLGGAVERVALVDEYQGPSIPDHHRAMTVRVWLVVGGTGAVKAEAAELRDRAVDKVRAWLDGAVPNRDRPNGWE